MIQSSQATHFSGENLSFLLFVSVSSAPGKQTEEQAPQWMHSCSRNRMVFITGEISTCFSSRYTRASFRLFSSPAMEETARQEQSRLWNLIATAIEEIEDFGASLVPLKGVIGDQDPEVERMIQCAGRTSTGPMSSVAGIFAERVGNRLAADFGLEEIVVENGGDLYVLNRTDLVTVIHAGDSPLSDKMGLVIPPGSRGICTSSGKLGHSFSQGNADAVTVICDNTALADAWATALCNRVQKPEDIDSVLDQVKEIEEILGICVILDDRVGVRGGFELKLLS